MVIVFSTLIRKCVVSQQLINYALLKKYFDAVIVIADQIESFCQGHGCSWAN